MPSVTSPSWGCGTMLESFNDRSDCPLSFPSVAKLQLALSIAKSNLHTHTAHAQLSVIKCCLNISPDNDLSSDLSNERTPDARCTMPDARCTMSDLRIQMRCVAQLRLPYMDASIHLARIVHKVGRRWLFFVFWQKLH